MKTFIWNDKDNALITWRDAAIADGFAKDDIATSKSADVDEVVEKCWLFEPDVVVLDIMHEKARPFGLKIAQGIRKRDPFVPILAATAYPDLVYNAFSGTKGAEDICLAGIYHESVMRPGLFMELAIRETLTRWHRSCKQYVLLRRCFLSLEAFRAEKHDKDTIDGVKRLQEELVQLAFSGSIETWHKDIGATLVALMAKDGLNDLGHACEEVLSLFRKADSFYMATGTSRRHVSHDVQVFAMGVPMLLANTNLRRFAEDDIQKVCGLSGGRALYRALLLWGCVSLTHDVAYLGQELVRVYAAFRNVAGDLEGAISSATGKPVILGKPMSCGQAPHGAIGGELWLEKTVGLDGVNKQFAARISDAVRRHDPKALKKRPNKVSASEWLSFLAILFDELQDWHRQKHSDDLKWELYELERFVIKTPPCGVTIEIEFVAQDLPLIAALVKGSPSKAEVAERLRKLKSTIEQKLDFEKRMEVTLAARFPRRDITPVNEVARI